MKNMIIYINENLKGTVSNTASYLRLWALSLAHSQLSKVFFENTLQSGIESGNILTVMLIIIFFSDNLIIFARYSSGTSYLEI